MFSNYFCIKPITSLASWIKRCMINRLEIDRQRIILLYFFIHSFFLKGLFDSISEYETGLFSVSSVRNKYSYLVEGKPYIVTSKRQNEERRSKSSKHVVLSRYAVQHNVHTSTIYKSNTTTSLPPPPRKWIRGKRMKYRENKYKINQNNTILKTDGCGIRYRHLINGSSMNDQHHWWTLPVLCRPTSRCEGIVGAP